MTTVPIVEHFDPFEHILSCFLPRAGMPVMHELLFQRPEEALDTGVVPAVTLAAPGAGDIAGPHAVRLLDRGLPVQGIVRHGQLVPGVGRCRLGANAVGSHEPRHAVSTNRTALRPELLRDPRAAVGVTGACGSAR